MLPGPAANARIWLRPGHTDMRKSINGLAALVERSMRLGPMDEALFVFCNRRCDIMKILFWERNGFCIWHKRLERDRFPYPDSEAAALELSPEQLRWLLDGIDFRREHQQIHFSHVG